jgi:hypothetical protein
VPTHEFRNKRRRESAPYGVADPRQVFKLAAVCALSGTDFVAFVAERSLARSKD